MFRGVASPYTCRPRPTNFWFDHSTACIINYALLERAKKIRGSTYCWGQYVLVMSQVVTAPRLSVNIQRILWGRTLYFLLFGRVSTSSVLTPSHLQIGMFFRYVWRIQETNWTLLVPCYLSNSVTQRSYVLFTTRSSNTWDATTKPRFDAKHRFQKRSFRTLRRQDERWRWGSTGLYFHDPQSNLRGLSGVSFKLVRHWLCCKCLSCALGCVDVLRPTLTAASTGTRLCEKLKRC